MVLSATGGSPLRAGPTPTKEALLATQVVQRSVAKGGLGKVNANGLKKAEGDTYSNDACGTSSVTLTIDVSVGVGNIDLETAP